MISLKHFTIGAIALIASMIFLASCDYLGRACTLMACHDGVTLHLHLPEEAVATSVRGEIRVDDQAFPFRCFDGAERPANWKNPSDSPEIRYSYCHMTNGTIMIAGPAREKPKVVAVTLSANDNQYSFQGNVRPAYTQTEINGPGCGWCSSGEAAIELREAP